MLIKKIFLVSGVLVSALVLSGCSLVAQPADVATESPVVTIRGKVMVAGEKVSIVEGAKTTEITSRKLDLKQYNGKEVEVTGEFSGTTLFVDSVK
jgi:hypothetical protein